MNREALIDKRFELLPHTADAMFRAYGHTIDEAYSNAALALYAIITDISRVDAVIKKEISVKSKNMESLLYDFLEELIYLTDTEGFLISKVEKLQISHAYGEMKVKAVLMGDRAGKYDVFSAIKAITYNEMKIVIEPNFCMVQVVPDL